jgi:hypothetical protein
MGGRKLKREGAIADINVKDVPIVFTWISSTLSYLYSVVYHIHLSHSIHILR